MNRQRTVLASLIAGCLLACAQLAVATAEPATDPRVADLARAGKVRVGLFLLQFIKDPATGQLRSVWVETARAFAGEVRKLVHREYGKHALEWFDRHSEPFRGGMIPGSARFGALTINPSDLLALGSPFAARDTLTKKSLRPVGHASSTASNRR